MVLKHTELRRNSPPDANQQVSLNGPFLPLSAMTSERRRSLLCLHATHNNMVVRLAAVKKGQEVDRRRAR